MFRPWCFEWCTECVHLNCWIEFPYSDPLKRLLCLLRQRCLEHCRESGGHLSGLFACVCFPAEHCFLSCGFSAHDSCLRFSLFSFMWTTFSSVTWMNNWDDKLWKRKGHFGSEFWRFQFRAWGPSVGPVAAQHIMAGMMWNILEGHSHLNYSGFWNIHSQVSVSVWF